MPGTPGRGWVMVRARFLTPEHVIHAMTAADYYSSSGVTLKDVRFDAESKSLRVEIDPEPGATYTTQFIGTLKSYDPTRRPVTDKDGNALEVTKRYSDDVGKVLATVDGTEATYGLTGDELFARAVVTSSRPPANPSFAGQKAQAWTQPFGWEKWVEASAPAVDAP